MQNSFKFPSCNRAYDKIKALASNENKKLLFPLFSINHCP